MKKESLYNLYSILAWIGAAIAFIGFILIGFSLTWIVLFIGCLITFTSLLALFISKKQEQTKHLEEQRKALKIQAEKYAHAKAEEETKAAE